MGIVAVAVILGSIFGIGIILYLLFVLFPILKGALFVGTHKNSIEKAFGLAGIKRGQKIIDIGSGDGRILFEAAKKGVISYGVEINPLLVWWTIFQAKKQGLGSLVYCQWYNFWWKNFSEFDIVFIYGITHIMKGLEKKLEKELKPGAKVIAFGFPFPNWQHKASENGIFLYEVK